MVLYYWNRYNAVATANYTYDAINSRTWQSGTLSNLPNAIISTLFPSSAQLYSGLNVNGATLTPHTPIDGTQTLLTIGNREVRYYVTANNGQVYAMHIKYVGIISETNAWRVTIESISANITYSQGSFAGTIQADQNAYINNTRNSDGFWYVRGGIVNTAPNYTQIPTQSTKKDIPITINLANYFSDPQGDALTYSVSSSNPSVATANVSGSTLTLTGKEIGSVWITVNANDGEFTTSQGFALNVTNTAPTVSVTSPNSNMTLYENDVFNIAGLAADVNANQSVTIYGQVNLESKFVMGIGLSNAAIPFSKQLKFKGGRLFDGDIGVTRNLTDGVPHTLKIWAQDSDGGQATIVERAFYVVPNRPPVLTVDAVQPSGIINTDKFKISGTASDPDKNPVTAAYRLNGGNSVELEIVEGKWAFDIALAQLVVGQNTIVIELMDSYDFKVSKTIKLNKNEVNTPILQSVARYKIEPPKGSAKGVLLFLERDEDMELEVSLSMTLISEQEQYVVLTPENTAPMPNQNNVVEDTFYYEATEPKNNIILKLSTSRENVDINHKIHLISGVVE